MSWEMVKLDKVCTMLSGNAWSASKFRDEGIIPIIRIQNLGNNVNEKFIWWNEAYDKKFVVKKGDLLLSLSGSIKIDTWKGVDALLNQRIVKLIPKNDVDAQWFYWQITNIILEIERMGKWALVNNVSITDLKDLEIPLPPLPIQKRIAEILDAADALKRKDQALLKKYDELAQAIFIDMFGDPVKNEKGWETKNLKSITSKIGSGATPTGGKTAYKATGISLIRSMNVYDFSFKWKDLAFIDDVQASKLNNVEVMSKDVLFNITGASVCRCSIVPDELLPARVNQHVAIIRAKTEILNPIFLNHLLVSNSVKTNLLGVGSGGGAVMEAITKDQLEQFEIIVPPIKLQNDFEQKINNVFRQKNIDLKSIETTENLFQTLIQKAFKGELVT
jgi:type I restriction enzyme S subunit